MLSFKNIKLVCIDVDGVLTDGKYFVSSDRLIFKSFYTRDIHAIEKLLKNDINVLIITQSSDGVINEKIHGLCLSSVFWKEKIQSRKLKLIEGITNKKQSIELCVLSDLIDNIKWENIAYIGDSENDLECMIKSHFSACPSDAILDVIKASNYVSSFSGGNGAVYDIANFILERIINEDIKS